MTASMVEQLRLMIPKPCDQSGLALPMIPAGKFAHLREVLSSFDQGRYGMPLSDLEALIHDSDATANFLIQFGITFEEYAERLVAGESLGKAMVDGKFKPRLPVGNV